MRVGELATAIPAELPGLWRATVLVVQSIVGFLRAMRDAEQGRLGARSMRINAVYPAL